MSNGTRWELFWAHDKVSKEFEKVLILYNNAYPFYLFKQRNKEPHEPTHHCLLSLLPLSKAIKLNNSRMRDRTRFP